MQSRFRGPALRALLHQMGVSAMPEFKSARCFNLPRAIDSDEFHPPAKSGLSDMND
jgi:hypothetical protein